MRVTTRPGPPRILSFQPGNRTVWTVWTHGGSREGLDGFAANAPTPAPTVPSFGVTAPLGPSPATSSVPSAPTRLGPSAATGGSSPSGASGGSSAAQPTPSGTGPPSSDGQGPARGGAPHATV